MVRVLLLLIAAFGTLVNIALAMSVYPAVHTPRSVNCCVGFYDVLCWWVLGAFINIVWFFVGIWRQ